MEERSEEPEETFTTQYAFTITAEIIIYSIFYREREEHRIYLALLRMVPGLEERLMTGDADIVHTCAVLVSLISSKHF